MLLESAVIVVVLVTPPKDVETRKIPFAFGENKSAYNDANGATLKNSNANERKRAVVDALDMKIRIKIGA